MKNSFSNGFPKITAVKFPKRKIQVILSDGRIILCPLNTFPEIKKLSPQQRKRYGTLAGIGLAFEDTDEVYHISDFLGLHNNMGL